MPAAPHLDLLREYEAGLSVVQRLDRRRHEVTGADRFAVQVEYERAVARVRALAERLRSAG
jgi:hypothetical protein